MLRGEFMAPSKVVTALGIFGVALCLSGAASDADVHSGGDAVLVEVNGVKLTMADLEQKRAAALFQARTAYYEAQRKAIEELVDENLLEQQAEKEGVTVPQLLERHVNAAIPKDPTEETLRVYYEGVDTTEPYASVRDKILEALRQRRMAKAKTAYLESLRSQVPILIRLAPARAPISMKDVPVRGTSSSHVTLVEYADYECPYCQQIQPVLDKIEAEFKGKLKFAYKDYPLPMHANAQKAAEAAHCAGAQSKYWEYHDLIAANKQVDPGSLKSYAKDLKLDTAAFDSCLATGQEAEVVKANLSEAQALGLQGTPTLFVNGRYVSGNLTYERIRGVISEELSATDGLAATPTTSSAVRNTLPNR
jgi:protein-disulfide isomerase